MPWFTVLVMAALAILSGCGGGQTAVIPTPAGSKGTAANTTPPVQVLTRGITPAASQIARGTSLQLIATAAYSDGSSQDINGSLQWSSSNPGVASVDQNGVVSGIAPGQATVTASDTSGSLTATVTVTSAMLQSIDVQPPAATIANGTSQQFIAVGYFSDQTTQDLTTQVTWASSSPNVTASNHAGSNGLTHGSATGSASIAAQFGTVHGAATLAVTSATLTSLQVDPSQADVELGTSLHLTAIGNFSDGSVQPLVEDATWASSESSVVAVDSTGLARALNVGETTVTATVGAQSATATLRVPLRHLQSITIIAPYTSLAQGTSMQLEAEANYSDGTSADATTAVTWSSSSPAVAISNDANFRGQAMALGSPATAVIIATLGEVTAELSITVDAARLVSISVSPTDPLISQFAATRFTAMGTFSDGSTQDLTATASWWEADPTVAAIYSGNNVALGHGTIDNLKAHEPASLATSGEPALAEGVGVGQTEITASQGGVSGSTTLSVTASTTVTLASGPVLESISVGPAHCGLSGENKQIQYTATGFYSDGSAVDLTQAVQWTLQLLPGNTSSFAAAATISNAPGSQGIVRTNDFASLLRKESQNFTVIATLNGVTGQVGFYVSPARAPIVF
jgi:uncharacterized protein YjdB